MKRDPHVLDLVLFLHPKKCLTCGEKFALLLVLETVPGTSSEPKIQIARVEGIWDLIQIVEVIPVKSKTYLKHYLH